MKACPKLAHFTKMSSIWRAKSPFLHCQKYKNQHTFTETHRHTPFSTQWCLNLPQYADWEGWLWWKLVQDHLGEIFCLWKQWQRVRWILQKQNLKVSLVQATTTATRQGCGATVWAWFPDHMSDMFDLSRPLAYFDLHLFLSQAFIQLFNFSCLFNLQRFIFFLSLIHSLLFSSQ